MKYLNPQLQALVKETDFKGAQPYLFGEDFGEKAMAKLEAAATLKSIHLQAIKVDGFSGRQPSQKQLKLAGWQAKPLWPWKIIMKRSGTNKQQTRKESDITKSFRSCVYTSCVKFNKVYQPYPQINTGGCAKGSLRGVHKPDGLDYK